MRKFIPFWLLLAIFATGLWTWGQFLIDPYRFATSTLNNGIVSYWKMDEASGTRIDAVTATGNDLSDNNTVTSNTGIISNAGQFTRANSEYLSHIDNASLSVNGTDFTVAVWVYMDTEPADNAIISKWGAGGNEYQMYYSQALDRFRFATTATVTANNFGAVTTGTWYLIIGWNTSTAAFISVNNTTADSVVAGYPAAGTSDFLMGNIGGSFNYWNGRLDEVGFWKRVLTADERTELYNSGAGKTCCPFAP